MGGCVRDDRNTKRPASSPSRAGMMASDKRTNMIMSSRRIDISSRNQNPKSQQNPTATTVRFRQTMINNMVPVLIRLLHHHPAYVRVCTFFVRCTSRHFLARRKLKITAERRTQNALRKLYHVLYIQYVFAFRQTGAAPSRARVRWRCRKHRYVIQPGT